MKNTLNTLLAIYIFLLLNACTKTGVDPAEKIVKEQDNERIIDTASYSRWLSARVPNALLVRHYKVISGTPRTLTADILKNGKVLVFGRDGELFQPYSLPHKHGYVIKTRTSFYGIIRTTYFKDNVASITVYDSLLSKYSYSTLPFALTTQYNINEFRCIIVPPALKAAAIRAKINWDDYAAVTAYFKIAP